jgi:hypothetical protein
VRGKTTCPHESKSAGVQPRDGECTKRSHTGSARTPPRRPCSPTRDGAGAQRGPGTPLRPGPPGRRRLTAAPPCCRLSEPQTHTHSEPHSRLAGLAEAMRRGRCDRCCPARIGGALTPPCLHLAQQRTPLPPSLCRSQVGWNEIQTCWRCSDGRCRHDGDVVEIQRDGLPAQPLPLILFVIRISNVTNGIIRLPR